MPIVDMYAARNPAIIRPRSEARQMIDERLHVAEFGIDLAVGAGDAVRVEHERAERDDDPRPRPQRVVRDVEEERREHGVLLVFDAKMRCAM